MPTAASDDDIITLEAEDNLLLYTDSTKLAKRYKPFAKPKPKPKRSKPAKQGTSKPKKAKRTPKVGDVLSFPYLVGNELVPFEGILVEETSKDDTPYLGSSILQLN